MTISDDWKALQINVAECKISIWFLQRGFFSLRDRRVESPEEKKWTLKCKIGKKLANAEVDLNHIKNCKLNSSKGKSFTFI